MADSLGIVILAAGKGTRLRTDVPKAICPLQGTTLVDRVLRNLQEFASKANLNFSASLVTGHKRESVEAKVSENWPEVKFAYQAEQKGTAHALQTYFEQIEGAWDKDFTLVVCADTPLIGANEYDRLYNEAIKGGHDGVAAVFDALFPKGYGRIVSSGKGFFIVEEKDASDEQRQIKTVNSGLYLIKTSHIKKHLSSIDDSNKSGEFYLTDLFKGDFNVKAVAFDDGSKFLGINNLVQLEEAASSIQKEKIRSLQMSGVRFLNSSSCYIEEAVEIGPGAVIYPNVVIEGLSKIGQNTIIEAGCVIKDAKINEEVSVFANSYIEKAEIMSKAKIGPMARVRPGSEIGENVKIGNFVETKNAKLHSKVSVSHLSYVGDAEIGENTNIGCGFITCNYDGAQKHKTVIGKNSFIGSDSQMIAPVTLGDGVFVASGSTINQDVPSGGFAIARQRQTTKEGLAKRFIKKKD